MNKRPVMAHLKIQENTSALNMDETQSGSNEARLRLCSWCFKTFFGGNLDFPKIKTLAKVYSDDWTCTKMWNQCYFKQNNTLKLLIAFKMAYYCRFSLGEI